MADRDEPLFGDALDGGPGPNATPPVRNGPASDDSGAPDGSTSSSDDAPQPGDDGPADDDGPPAQDDRPWSPGGSGPSPADDRLAHDVEEARPRRGQGSPDRSAAPGSFWRELPVLLLVALVLAFLLRSFVVQVFYIPSSSMEPTLNINDRMVVEKVTYLFRDPERGDVVVFEGDDVADPDVDRTAGERVVRGVGQFLGVVPTSARDFVKRVIGLPGDEVEITGGVVRVNGVTLDEPYVVFEDPSDYGPVTVPEGTLFFLGDNRPNSSDSRRGLGFVPLDHVVGRSAVIIWPFENAGLLTGVEHDLGAVTSTPVDEPTAADLAG